MKRTAPLDRPASVLAALLVVLVAACGSSDSPGASDSPGPSGPVDVAPLEVEAAEAVDAGARYLQAQHGAIDIASLSLIAYIGNNWQNDTLVAAHEAAQLRLATADLDPEEAAMIRLADPARSVDGVSADDFAPESTSASLAAVLRCDDDTLSPSDLAVEQSAVLHYLEAGDRVPSSWLDRVLAAQRTDGGWGEQASTWHMTLLAVWTILAETEPGTGIDMVGSGA